METIGTSLLLLGPLFGVWLLIQVARKSGTRRILKSVIGLCLLLFPVVYVLTGNNSHKELKKELIGVYLLSGNVQTTLTLLDDSTFTIANDTILPIEEKGKWDLTLHDFDQLDLNFENQKKQSFEVIRRGDSIILSDGIATLREKQKFVKRID